MEASELMDAAKAMRSQVQAAEGANLKRLTLSLDDQGVLYLTLTRKDGSQSTASEKPAVPTSA